MIRKVYEVDLMICPNSEASYRTAKRCPKCGGRMKVVAFITEVALMEAMRTSKAAVVDRIIDHLKLRFVADRPPPSRVLEQVALPAAASACTQGDEFAAP